MMTRAEILIEHRKDEAKKLRYKKPMCRELNLYAIREFLSDAGEEASEIGYAMCNDEAFTDALGGDEEEAFEFRNAYGTLCADMEHFAEDLDEQWVPECFDTFFAAVANKGDVMLGYDEFECDYYGLGGYEADAAREEAATKLKRMTKADFIDAAQQCFSIAVAYLGLRSRYEDLASSLAIIRVQNDGLLGAVKRLEELYEMSQGQGFDWNWKLQREFDDIAQHLPDECWTR